MLASITDVDGWVTIKGYTEEPDPWLDGLLDRIEAGLAANLVVLALID